MKKKYDGKKLFFSPIITNYDFHMSQGAECSLNTKREGCRLSQCAVENLLDDYFAGQASKYNSKLFSNFSTLLYHHGCYWHASQQNNSYGLEILVMYSVYGSQKVV